MSTLIIDKQGASIGLKQNRFTITLDDKEISSIPKMLVTKAIIVGRATFSQQVLDFFFAQSIPLCFISVYGKFKGFLCGEAGKNVFVRMQQYLLYNDEEYRLLTAKSIIRQKVNNYRRSLAKYNRYHHKEKVATALKKMRAISSTLQPCENLNEVMGIEGACAAAYFEALGDVFNDSAFSFTKRSTRPPLDPVNAMLSLGYTLLLSEIVSAIYSTGLDPYVGYLHSVDYGRVSLACDLQEEFRFIIDELIIKLINLGQIKPEDFERNEEGAVLLLEPARKIFFKAYEEKINQQAIFQRKRSPYRSIIRQQAQHMGKCLVDKAVYQPYKRSAV